MNIEDLKNKLKNSIGNNEIIDRYFEEYRLSNNTFGMLELIEKNHEKQGKVWKGLYRCKCGNEKSIQNAAVKRGAVKSCGCIKNNGKISDFNACGLSKTVEYRAYYAMRARCENKEHEAYVNYGARGITVCARWRGIEGFRNFLDDMGMKIDKRLSLDRIDVNRGYSPENCRWASASTQQTNRRVYGKHSKYAGISFDSSSGKFTATIMYKGEYVYSKRFDTEKEAVVARDRYIRRHSLDSTLNLK